MYAAFLNSHNDHVRMDCDLPAHKKKGTQNLGNLFQITN